MEDVEYKRIIAAARQAAPIGDVVLGPLELMEPLVDYPEAACTILRCRTVCVQSPTIVVVKHWNRDYDALRTERIALEFFADLPAIRTLVPHLYASHVDAAVLVMEDLGGTSDELVGKILYRRDAVLAESALKHLVMSIGQLHAETIPRTDDYLTYKKRIGAREASRHRIHRIVALMVVFEASLNVVGASLSDAGGRELELAIREVNKPGPFLALTHGDVTPGNAFFDGHHIRVFDFETSDLRHALLDGSFARLRYLHSVWANRIPDPIQHRLMECYRAELVLGCPEAADNHRFNHALLSCAFAWVAALCEELPSAWHADRKWGSASTRQQIVAALEHFHQPALECGEFEALATDVLNLSLHLRNRWHPSDCDIPTFPAFQNLDVS